MHDEMRTWRAMPTDNIEEGIELRGNIVPNNGWQKGKDLGKHHECVSGPVKREYSLKARKRNEIAARSQIVPYLEVSTYDSSRMIRPLVSLYEVKVLS